MNLNEILRNAAAKTVVRKRLEAIWEKKGRLYKKEFNSVANHSAIDRQTKRIVRPYFDTIVVTSKHTTRLLRQESPEEIFTNIYEEKPQKSIEIKSMPYGIHLYLSVGDLRKTINKNEEIVGENFMGGSIYQSYSGIMISVGSKTHPNFEGFIDQLMEGIGSDEQSTKGFEEDYGISLKDFLKIYNAGKIDPLAIPVIMDARENYIRCQKLQENIAYHELEHSHSRLFLQPTDSVPVQKLALGELISYANHYSLEVGRLDVEGEDKEINRKIHKKFMGIETFNQFIDLLQKLKKRAANGTFNTYKKRRVLPMFMLEIGNFDFVRDNFNEMIAKVSSLKGRL